MELREPILMCVTGMKKVGKTFTTTRSLNKYIRSNPKTGKKGRKILIYDINKEYTQYKAIAVKDIGKFSRQTKVEIRRILPVNDDGSEANLTDMIEILEKIISNFRGGLLLLEDINRYMIASKSVEIIGLLATNRHRDLDIICHYQSLSALDPRMWQNTAMVRFHFQIDAIDRYKNRIPNYELFKITQLLVNYRYQTVGDKRFYVYVANDENKIIGAFTRKEFRLACMEYLDINSMLVNSKARSYKGVSARETAKEDLCRELEQKYFQGIAA